MDLVLIAISVNTKRILLLSLTAVFCISVLYIYFGFFNMYSQLHLSLSCATVDSGQSHVKEAFLWESIRMSQQERREIHVCSRQSAHVSVPNYNTTDDQLESIFI